MKRFRCAIYTRKSSAEGLEQDFNSLAAQREACEAYIKSQAGEGWRALPRAYDDGGYSGGTMARPALQTLLADIDSGAVDVVVVYKVDRLTRALMDFSRIVDRLDAKNVSFVSVTQSFNTTTSMGRLTLNVLLSFAQFERELTSERIKDKIAASKKKGMWMGGIPPLGYAAVDRKLEIAPEEADRVRSIYGRYLSGGSLRDLADALAAAGVTSKRHVTKAGAALGGKRVWAGPLRYILSNRTYLGEIRHGDVWYPGLHAPIIDADLFDRVQARLADRGSPAVQDRTTTGAPLMGLVYDDAGFLMGPHYARKSNGQHYSYYVSRAVLRTGASVAGTRTRVNAHWLEGCVAGACERVFGWEKDWPSLRRRIRRVTLSKNDLLLEVDGAGVHADLCQARLGAGEALDLDDEPAKLRVPVHQRPWRGLERSFTLHGRPTNRHDVDRSLVSAIARAHVWRAEWIAAETSFSALSRRVGLDPSYALRMMRLAYLAPDLLRAALAGAAPMGLTVERVARLAFPTDWERQRQLFSVADDHGSSRNG